MVDVWFSYDKHGHFDDGTHVFLAPVAVEDDLLKHLAPDHFTSAHQLPEARED